MWRSPGYSRKRRLTETGGNINESNGGRRGSNHMESVVGQEPGKAVMGATEVEKAVIMVPWKRMDSMVTRM